LQSIRHALLTSVLPKVKIHELFQLNIDKIVAEFQEKVRAGLPPVATKEKFDEELTIIPDSEFGRLTATIDMNKALQLYNIYRYAEYYTNNNKKYIHLFYLTILLNKIILEAIVLMKILGSVVVV